MAPSRAQCGEGPIWDHRAGLLRWVDIAGESFHAFDPASGHDETIKAPYLVSSILLEKGGGLLTTTANGLERWDSETGALELLHQPELELVENRFNDAKTDTLGRLWAGTMSKGAEAPSGSIYCYDQSGVRRVSGGYTVSNGMGWSANGRRFYFVDSIPGVIHQFVCDPGTAELSARTEFVRFDRNLGTPDGLCVDSRDNIWVAMWDGSRVIRLSPEGEVTDEITMPVRRPTSCCLGGPDLQTLYITSAASGSPDDPIAGGLFAAHVDIPGLPATETLRFDRY